MKAERGSASLEFVLVVGALLALVTGTVQVGLWWYAKAGLVAAANEGARVAGTAAGSEAAGEQAARRVMASLGSFAADPAVKVEIGVETVTVSAAARVTSIVPFLPSVPAGAEATVAREVVAAGAVR